MNTYKITNTVSGADLGTYEAEGKAQALDAMARDAGYDTYEALCLEVPALEGEIKVSEV